MKKHLLKIIPALLVALVVLFTAACGDSYDPAKQELHEELYGDLNIPTASAANISLFNTIQANFALAYSRTDSLNPYRATSSLNSAVSALIFDKLIAVTEDYDVEPVIARSITQSGSDITVVVRDGLVFSDGAELTARDVEYSFYVAKRSKSKYAAQLENFKSVIVNGNKLTFTIGEPDPFAYMLLDIPIIKIESDAGGAMPTGSGKYVYISDEDLGIFLERNDRWFDPDRPSIERISLNAMPTVESIVHSIEIGTISYFITDLRDGYPSRINANYTTFDVNNIIYLGVNTNDTRLYNIDIRTAISYSLNREEIATKAFGGRALAATGPITAAFEDVAPLESGSTVNDPSSAKFLLSNAGYVNTDENGYTYDSLGNYLSFSILVSGDNSQHLAAANVVAGQLSDAGISTSINEVSSSDFATAVAAGNYQLYIGEYALLNNMDFSPLFTPGSGMYTGFEFDTLNAAHAAWKTGTGTLSAYLDAFEANIPFIPLCHRQGMVCYSRSLNADMDVSESDPFHGMNEWTVTAVTVGEDGEAVSSKGN